MLVSAGELRDELRHGSSPFLTARRAIAGLSVFSGVIMGGIGLFQMGIYKNIPEPKWEGLDANKVNGSLEAYSMFGTPDALLGMASYAATACLAGMGGKNRWKHTPWIPLAMAGKTAVDTALAAKLTVDQWTKYRAFCIWCLMAAAATFATAPLALPEAKAAWKRLQEV
jgi:uncharacterized membrane protein